MKHFLTSAEESSVVEAIRQAELKTHGEIRIVICRRWIWRLERYAWTIFRRLKMTETKERNGALIVVLAKRRKFAVIGDRGLNEKVADDFWQDIADKMGEQLKSGHRSQALIEGVDALAETMALHWPAEGENPNELPDHIAYD